MSSELSAAPQSNVLDAIMHQEIIDAKNLAKKLSESAVFNSKAASNDGLVLTIIDKAPFFTDLLSKIDGTGNAVINLVEVTGHVSTTVVGMTRGLQIAGIVLDSFNVIRIPFVYLVSAMLGKKPPITLSNNAQWFYSVVLLSLAIMALIVPVTAPFIAIAASSLVSMVGLFTLGRLYYQRYQAEKMVNRLEEDLGPLIDELNELQTKAEAAHTTLDLPLDHAEKQLLIDQIIRLDKQFNNGAMLETIQAKYTEKSHHIAFLKKQNRIEVLDKVVGITFSALAVLAALVALVFPPAALAILIGTGTVGTGYTVARILGALFTKSTAPQSIVIKSANPTIRMSNAELEAEMKRVQDEQKKKVISSYEITHDGLTENSSLKTVSEQPSHLDDNKAINDTKDRVQPAVPVESPLMVYSVFHHDAVTPAQETPKNDELIIAIGG